MKLKCFKKLLFQKAAGPAGALFLSKGILYYKLPESSRTCFKNARSANRFFLVFTLQKQI